MDKQTVIMHFKHKKKRRKKNKRKERQEQEVFIQIVCSYQDMAVFLLNIASLFFVHRLYFTIIFCLYYYCEVIAPKMPFVKVIPASQ